MQSQHQYSLAAGVDVVPLPDDALLFRSGTLAVKVEGSMAGLLAQRVLPLLDLPRTLEYLASQLPDLAADVLQQRLDSLAAARVLERSESRATLTLGRPFDAFVGDLGVESGTALERLQAAKVVIVGLEAHGAHLALELARLGLGTCVLADPFPILDSDELLMPNAAFRVGGARQDAVASALNAQSPSSSVRVAPELSRDSIQALAREASVVVGCFDRGYETAQHWVNRAAVAEGVPALFAEIRTHVATLGPGVLPGQTACYMCYRMRRVACEDNYDEAMAYERFLNSRNQPSLSSRATAPFLPSYVASVLAGEIVKLLALGLPMSVTGRTMEFDALTLESRFHSVLRQPDCPVCAEQKKKNQQTRRENLDLAELIAAENRERSGDLRRLTAHLVSPRTGVVRRFEAFVKDPVEPAQPYIVRADIANHRFISGNDDDGDVCSGKGLTLEDARVSALGEAVERYSGAVHSPAEVLYAKRCELAHESLNPSELVLYHPSQYRDVPYAPYDDNRLGWIAARSLVSGADVLVPAIAVFMNYHAHEAQEFILPITSNGLATGRTLVDAVWSAAVEVLERDGFMVAWLNRLPARRYSAREHPEPQIATLAESYCRRGVEIRLYRMPTDHEIPVFAAVALEPDERGGPAAVVGLGADPDPVWASHKAVLEVCQVRPALRRRLRSPEARTRLRELMQDPHRVATINDHDLLYADRDSLPRLGFWLDADPEPFTWTAAPAVPRATLLASLLDWLRARGRDLLYVNLTPPDMAELGLYTARAILPGFQPIDFGWKERRLGGNRVYELPATLGFRDHVGHIDELNDDPHPLA
jgi:ribosomal protein S12 methylthiotransferase accessory factor